MKLIWQMNMPVSPELDAEGNYSEEWYAWVAGRHPDNFERAVEEWTKYLKGKIIGKPKTQALKAEEYEKWGWVGMYEEEKPVVLTERTIRVRKQVRFNGK